MTNACRTDRDGIGLKSVKTWGIRFSSALLDLPHRSVVCSPQPVHDGWPFDGPRVVLTYRFDPSKRWRTRVDPSKRSQGRKQFRANPPPRSALRRERRQKGARKTNKGVRRVDVKNVQHDTVMVNLPFPHVPQTGPAVFPVPLPPNHERANVEKRYEGHGATPGPQKDAPRQNRHIFRLSTRAYPRNRPQLAPACWSLETIHCLGGWMPASDRSVCLSREAAKMVVLHA